MDSNCRSYSDSLKNTLNCYQLTSADSLSGPSSFPALAAHLWYKENNQAPPTPRPPVVQIPLLIPNDTSTKRAETTLSGHVISCFVVGGEMRLCLPQILTSVLKNFSISEINRTCAELHIYCSRCSPEQLEILKVLGILPFNTTQCGLITKTDSERLVSALEAEYDLNGKHDFNTDKMKGIPVYHECFGKGEGVFYPDLYTTPESTCIACLNCRIKFSPARFVTHSHRSLEKRICHWGFNRDNWRYYLLVPRNIEDSKYKDFEKQLNLVKLRFDLKAQEEAYTNSVNNLKRRLKTEGGAVEVNNKRIKDEKCGEPKSNSPTSPVNCFGLAGSLRSAFKPWTGSLPPNVAGLVGIPDASILKAYSSLFQDRRLLPSGLLHNPVSSQNSDWSGTVFPPNLSLQLADLQKSLAASAETERGSRSQKSDKHVCEKPAFIKTEGALQNGFYPESYRRVSGDHHPKSRPTDKTRSSLESRPGSDPSSTKGISNNGHEIKKHYSFDSSVPERTEVLNLKQPKKTDKETTRNNESEKQRREKERSAAVAAAATAMLQLSSGEDISNSQLRKDFFDNSDKVLSLFDESSSYPKVVPLDSRKNFNEWIFRDRRYVLSLTNSRDLMTFHKLLSFIDDGAKREKLFEEIVKVMQENEEKISNLRQENDSLIQELNRLKLSNTRSVQEASDLKSELRHELEQARNVYHNQLKDANDNLISLGKRVADMSRHPGCQEGRDILQHKILDRLHKQVDDKEEALRQMEKELLDERDSRLLAESHVKELKTVLREHRAMEKHDSAISKSICKNVQSPTTCNSTSPLGGSIKAGNVSPSRSLIRCMLSSSGASVTAESSRT